MRAELRPVPGRGSGWAIGPTAYAVGYDLSHRFAVLGGTRESRHFQGVSIRADKGDVAWVEEFEEREIMLNRFRKLVGELTKGELRRNSFQPRS